MDDLSLLVMKPPCQDRLKHIVLTEENVTDKRFCLSFRYVVPISPETLKADIDYPHSRTPTTVLIGTSITSRINPHRVVGKSATKFHNCSTSGDKVLDASHKVDRLYAGTLTDQDDKLVDGDSTDVQNIIFSVGTNDIRRKSNGVLSMFSPVKALLAKTRVLFPKANIYVQSLIPMGFEHSWTPRNVLEFNSILRRCVREVPNCAYIDVFNEFLDGNRRYPRKALFHDSLHPSHKGSSVLARAFIMITRGRNFDVRL
jgi:lysophospholipase L1-like esterase